MKKLALPKLKLNLKRETVRQLETREGGRVLGGSGVTTECDSICILCTW